MALAEHTRKSESEPEVLCEVALDVGADVVSIIVEVVDVTFLSEISE